MDNIAHRYHVLLGVPNGRTRPDKMGGVSDAGGAWGTYPKYTISIFDWLTKVTCRDVLYQSERRSSGSFGTQQGCMETLHSLCQTRYAVVMDCQRTLCRCLLNRGLRTQCPRTCAQRVLRQALLVHPS